MDRKLYELEGLRQLTNTHYTEIERPLANETATLLQNTLNDIYRSSFLSEKQLRYLSSEVPEKSQPFYLLPKVHKPTDVWKILESLLILRPWATFLYYCAVFMIFNCGNIVYVVKVNTGYQTFDQKLGFYTSFADFLTKLVSWRDFCQLLNALLC